MLSLSQSDLHSLFDYQNDTLIWKDPPHNEFLIGEPAGRLSSCGYMYTEIFDTDFRLHRLIWVYHNGDIPDGMLIDHIDGDKLNNAIGNLRLATTSQNRHNMGAYKGSVSRFKGVAWHKKNSKWRVQIRIDGKVQHIGYYEDEREAAIAYDKVARELHGEFYVPNIIP